MPTVTIPSALTMRALHDDARVVEFTLTARGTSVLYLDDAGVWGTAAPSRTIVRQTQRGTTYRMTRADAAVMLSDAVERADAGPNGTDHSRAERAAARTAAAAIRAALTEAR